MRWKATLCSAGISSRTEGQRAPDKRTRDPSLAMWNGRKLDFDRQGMSIGATGLAALRSLFRA
jgi:hypothetical protein